MCSEWISGPDSAALIARHWLHGTCSSFIWNELDREGSMLEEAQMWFGSTKYTALYLRGVTLEGWMEHRFKGMKRSCPGVRCYMSLSKGNILWYRSKPITATLSHLSQGTNMRFTFPLQASLVSASARMMGKHGSTFSHKFPICSCHQSQDWSSAGDLTRPGFLLIQS